MGEGVVWLQVCELLAEHLTQWSYSPAFPELALIPVLNLRRFAKASRVDKFRKAAKGLMDAIERWASGQAGSHSYKWQL